MPARVLVVEREPRLREAITRSIEVLPNVQVHGTDTVSQALAHTEEPAPDAVVMDLQAPEELVERLLSEIGGDRGGVPIILLCTCPPTATSGSNANLDLRGLRRLVENALRSAPRRRPPPFTLDEYLQLASFGRHSVSVHIRAPGGHRGEIIVWEGDICDARDEGGRGPDAFRRLAAGALNSAALVACEARTQPPPSRSLRPGQWQALLFDTARLQDEGVPPPPAAPPKVRETVELPAVDDSGLVIPMPGVEAPLIEDPPPRPGQDFDDLVEHGVDALLRKDHALALSYFEDAENLRPGSPFVRGNISRLREVLDAPP